jgi:tetratricopeptide (TPR) repeat protein
VKEAQQAVDLDPQFAIYRFQLGVVQGQWYLTTRDPTLLSDAIGQMEKGLELEPRSAVGHANLALLLAEAGERQDARTEALAALDFANKDPAVVLAVGTALEMTNWGDDAVKAYSRALLLDMGLADSSFWSESPFRLTRFSDIVGQSAIIFNPCGLLRLTAAGVPAGPLSREEALVACRDDLAANPGNEAGKVTLAEALIDDGLLDEAFVLIDQVLDLQPDHGGARTALGRWHAARGELEEAREQWLRASQLDQVEALVLLGDSYPVDGVPAEVVDALRSELRLATSQVQFHLTGILYYRFKFFRGSPHAILLPGDWQRAVPGRYARAEMALERWTGETDSP